jgi:putative oxidoreductase
MKQTLKNKIRESTLLAGRILFGMVFFKDAADHFSRSMIDSATAKGVWMPEVLVPLSGVIAILGGIMVITGFKTKLGAGLIVKVLVPVTVVMHDFWNMDLPFLFQLELDLFIKNVGLIGGALFLVYFGPGPWSVDAKLKAAKARKLTTNVPLPQVPGG